MGRGPRRLQIFPDTLSVEPQGPVVRNGDPAWKTIVAWTIHALVHAERLGVTAEAVARPSGPHPSVSPSRERDRFLGMTPGIGAPLGLDDRWAVRAVEAVGNYGEMFHRYLTVPFAIPRGPNALWRDGGLVTAPLLR